MASTVFSSGVTVTSAWLNDVNTAVYGVTNVKTNGVTGNGTTNDAAALNAIYALGGTVYHPAGTYFIGTTQLNIPANTKLTFAKGAKFTVTSSTPGTMPQAYLMITGSNVEIDGAVGFIAANPFTVYAQKGAFIGFGASSISNIRIRNCDSNWFMHGVFGSATAGAVANSVANVVIENCRFTSFATDIYHTGKSATNWLIDGNIFDGVRVSPSNNAGAIGIYGNIDVANADAFTQADYDSNCSVKFTIVNNQIGAVLDRPIRIANAKQVVVSKNSLTLGVGSYFTGGAGTTFSADAITFDLCRQVVCTENNITGGGENGIDLLSSQDAVVANNVIKQVNTDGVYVFMSDLYVASALTPKLSGVTTRESLISRNIDIHNNYIEAFICVYVGEGQSVNVHDNSTKVNSGSTAWVTGASTPQHLSLDNTSVNAFFNESAAYYNNNIFFSNNRPVLKGPISVTHNSGTSLFTTVGGIAHGFVTGDLVETAASGACLTVDYPSGLNYTVDYYVIKVSSTTFKLASSWVNAFAGTAITTTTNGLTVVGSVLLVKEQVWLCGVNISASYYTPMSNITLDEGVPGYRATNLFSTFPVLNPGTAFLYRKSKHTYLYDPAVSYSLNRNLLAKGVDLTPVASNGTVVFGISEYSIQSGGYQYQMGAKPANIIGTPADGQIRSALY